MAMSWASPAFIAGTILFGVVGIAAYRYGRHTEQASKRWLGFVLMIFPYAMLQTWQLYLVGSLLCLALFWKPD